MQKFEQKKKRAALDVEKVSFGGKKHHFGFLGKPSLTRANATAKSATIVSAEINV